MPQQMGGPALGIAPVTDEKSHVDAADSLGRSALMTQLTKPADEMLQVIILEDYSIFFCFPMSNRNKSLYAVIFFASLVDECFI